MKTKFEMAITGKEMDELCEKVKAHLMDETQVGGAWFHSEEDMEEWAGDVFYDAIDYAFELIGVTFLEDYDDEESEEEE